jgi:hypothetical protein
MGSNPLIPTNLNAHEIVIKGTAIYERKYRAEFEQEHRDQFAVIDVRSEHAYIADFPEEALSKAKTAAPNGVFYLLRIGSSGAFKMRHARISLHSIHRYDRAPRRRA